MRNFHQVGDTLQFVADKDYESGVFARVGVVYGYTVDKTEEGKDLLIKTSGVFNQALPGFVAGDAVFHNGTTFVDAQEDADTLFVGFCVGANLLRLQLQYAPFSA